MKIKDITRFGSLEEVRESFSKMQEELRICALKLPIAMYNDYTGHGLKNLVNTSSTLIERQIKFIEEPIEISAWIARNLFECYLMASYITSNPEKAKEFFVQKATDELEIYEGLLSLNKINNTKTDEAPIRQRMEKIRTVIKKHDLIEGSYWTVGMLAKQTGNREEYDAFFKLYSKYVHPTSWLINGQRNEYDSPTYRNIFWLQSQYYASCLLKLASDHKLTKT